jgi:hypothetical protein
MKNIILILTLVLSQSLVAKEWYESKWTKWGAVCAVGSATVFMTIEETKNKAIASAGVCAIAGLYEGLDYLSNKNAHDREEEMEKMLASFIKESSEAIVQLQGQMYQEQVVFKDLMAKEVEKQIMSGNNEIFMRVKQEIMASIDRDKDERKEVAKKMRSYVKRRMKTIVKKSDFDKFKKELESTVQKMVKESKLNASKEMTKEELAKVANEVMSLLVSDELYDTKVQVQEKKDVNQKVDDLRVKEEK